MIKYRRILQLYFNDLQFIALITAIILISYWNSIGGAFIWDDRAAIIGNGDVTGKTNITEIFYHDFWGQDITLSDSHKSYRPFTVLTFRLDHVFYGLNAYGYHVSNIVIYIMTTISVYYMSLGWLTRPGARISTIIFATHPVHVEAVTSIVGRADCLCGLFYSLSIMFYTNCTQQTGLSSTLFFVLAILCATFASLAKEIGVTVFAILGGLEFIRYIQKRQISDKNFIQIEVLNVNSQKNQSFFSLPSLTSEEFSSPSTSSSSTSLSLPSQQQQQKKDSSKLKIQSKSHGKESNESFQSSPKESEEEKHSPITTTTSTEIMIEESHSYLLTRRPKKFQFWINFQYLLKLLQNFFFQNFHDIGFYRVICLLFFLCIFFSFRFSLHGESMLYQWTIMENHVDFLQSPFLIRILSYGQTHFWYLWKLIYPKYLCFDYGYYCIPMIISIWDLRNLLPILTYFSFFGLCFYAIKIMKFSLFVGILLFFFPLLPALNIFLPVGTLLAERLLFVPSIGFCLLIGDLLTSMDGLWRALDGWIENVAEVYDPWIYEKLSTFLPARKDEDDQEDEDNDDDDHHDGSTSPKKKSVRFNFQKSSKSGGNKNTKKKSPSTSPKNTENNNTSPKNQPTSTTTHPAPASYYDDEDESNGVMTIQIKYYKFSILSFLLFPFLWNGCLRTMKRNIDWHSEFNIYSSALQVCPYSIKALSNYAMLVSATTGEFENSLQAALTAMEYYPENPAAIINAGVAYQKAGQHLKAIELFEFGTQFPLATKSFGYLGSTIYNWIPLIQNPIYKDYLREICLRWISLSLEKGFGPPGILHIGGSVAFDKRDLILAIQYYETAVYYALKNQELRQGSKDVPIEDDVHIAWTYNQIGNCFNDLGNLTKAIEYYEKGLAIDGNSLPLLANSAIVYRVLKNYDKSREMLTRGIALTPGKPSPALLNNLGSLEMELANYAQALSLFEQAYASIQAEKKGDQFVAKQDGVEFRYDAFGTSVEGVIRANIEEAREKLAAATAAG